MKKLLSVLFLSAITLTACKKAGDTDLPDGLYANIETDKGEIILQLAYEKAPVTVANFVALAEGNHPEVEEQYKGKPFYDGLIFHRVIPDFMIQTGDPNGNGSGGPGYDFHDEIVEDLKHDKAGVLSMANRGQDTNGSQFFITHKETPHLNGVHAVFGHVVEGQEVVNAIAQNDKIISVKIIRSGNSAKGFDAPKTYSEGVKEHRVQAIKAKEEQAETIQNALANASQVNGVKVYVFENGDGEKPNVGEQVLIHYAGFLEDGTLFDTSLIETAEKFNKVDIQRKNQNAYQPIPFVFGNDQGLIEGFIQGVEHLKYGDKALVFIPSDLAYKERGVPGIIPPNTNLVFEMHLTKK